MIKRTIPSNDWIARYNRPTFVCSCIFVISEINENLLK